jgi:hypothetical protein
LDDDGSCAGGREAGLVGCRLRGLHPLRRRRKVGNDGADAVLQVSAFEGFVVDAIMDPADLAFDRNEATVELLDCVIEIRFRDHVVLYEIDGLKNVLCVFVHMREYSMAVVGGTNAAMVWMSRIAKIGKKEREFWKRGSCGLDATCITDFNRGEASGARG